ncbi:GIY-YIG nuclease family protein [Nonlabens antarcticus]|uniref:GIY-YIG nuclease family protein n=1 Tax=Nonlabens antarcticus TaxID=392714 RepID=UPI0018915021|nr:GIY-YIG nuclease family protein [Nonlabens antarcticus]
MKHFVFILWSDRISRYYCGETSNMESRLETHNNLGAKYTSRGIPWKLVKNIEVESRSEARKLERKIKKRGIGRYLDDLK